MKFSRSKLKVSPIWTLGATAFLVDPRLVMSGLLLPQKLRLRVIIAILAFQVVALLNFIFSDYNVKHFMIDCLITSIVLYFLLGMLSPGAIERLLTPFRSNQPVLSIVIFTILIYSCYITIDYTQRLFTFSGSVTEFRYFNGSIYIYLVMIAFFGIVKFKSISTPIILIIFSWAIIYLEEHGLFLALLLFPCFSVLYRWKQSWTILFVFAAFCFYVVILSMTHPLFGLRSQEIADLSLYASFDVRTIFGGGLGYRPVMSEALDFRGEYVVSTYGFFHLSICYVFAKVGLFGLLCYVFLLAKVFHRILSILGPKYGALMCALLFSLEIYAGGLVSSYFGSLILFSLFVILVKCYSIKEEYK